MQAFSTSLSIDPHWNDDLLEICNEVNLELKSLYLWYHTKMNIECMSSGKVPDDGVMGKVLGVFLNHDGIEIKMRLAVDYTAVHDASLFTIHPVARVSESGFELLGFSVFPK
jgi:hypothetical protein